MKERICSSCELPIPAARLVARPNATRCVSCQEAFDVPIREESVAMHRLQSVSYKGNYNADLEQMSRYGMLSSSRSLGLSMAEGAR